jgi:hypothetical protein
MPLYTQVTGFALIALAALSFASTGMSSLLAAFPALAGFPLVIYGDAARTPAKKARAMHMAVLVAMLGWLLALPFAWRAFQPRPADAPWPPGAFVGLWAAVVCAAYVAVSIAFFVRRRRATAASSAAGSPAVAAPSASPPSH